jgi:hypothetical protein
MSQKLATSPAVIGIDIGKNSFHIVGQNLRGAIVLRQNLRTYRRHRPGCPPSSPLVNLEIEDVVKKHIRKDGAAPDPCGVPDSTGLHWPLSRTPASSHRLISGAPGGRRSCAPAFASKAAVAVQRKAAMANILVRRDHFNITPQGITHTHPRFTCLKASLRRWTDLNSIHYVSRVCPCCPPLVAETAARGGRSPNARVIEEAVFPPPNGRQ